MQLTPQWHLDFSFMKSDFHLPSQISTSQATQLVHSNIHPIPLSHNTQLTKETSQMYKQVPSLLQAKKICPQLFDYWKRGRQSRKHCLQATDWWGEAAETSPGWVTQRSRDRCGLALREAAPSLSYMFGGAWASIVLFGGTAPPQAWVHLRHHLPLLHWCDRHACHFTLHLRPCGDAAVEACAGPSLSLSGHGAWGSCCNQNKAEYTASLTT